MAGFDAADGLLPRLWYASCTAAHAAWHTAASVTPLDDAYFCSALTSCASHVDSADGAAASGALHEGGGS